MGNRRTTPPCGENRPSVAPGAADAVSGGAYPMVKLVVEWCAAALLLVLAAPVIACLAVLLKCTSEGPVYYSQMRLGLNGAPFRIFKLRTMTHRCEATTGPVWSTAYDPRVTRVGRWLR